MSPMLPHSTGGGGHGGGESSSKYGSHNGFDTFLRKAMKVDWREHYVDYTKIKFTINHYVHRRKELYKLGLLRSDENDDTDDDQQQLWTEEDYLLLQRHIQSGRHGGGKVDEEQGKVAVGNIGDDYVLVEGDCPPTPRTRVTKKHTTAPPTSVVTTTNETATSGDYFRYEEGGKGKGPSSPAATSPTSPKDTRLTMLVNSHKEAVEYLSEVERLDICTLLEEEAIRSATFYGTRLAELSRWIHHDLSLNSASTALGNTLSNIENDNEAGNGNVAAGTDTESDIITFGQVGLELLEAFCFVVTNVITIRQSLIRYDAFARTYDGAPIVWPSSSAQEGNVIGTSHVISSSSIDDINGGGGGRASADENDGVGGGGGGPAAPPITTESAVILPNPAIVAATFVENNEHNYDYNANKFLEPDDENATTTAMTKTMELLTNSAEENDDVVGSVSNNDECDRLDVSDVQDEPTQDRMKVIFDLGPLRKLQRAFLSKLQQQYVATGSVEISEYMQEFTNQLENLGQLLDKTSTEMEFSDPLVFRDRFIYTLRRYFLVGSMRNGLILEPKFLLLRGRHLKKEMEDVAKWRRTIATKPELLRLGPGDAVTTLMDDGKKGLDPENVIPLILNLVSCFLFMMNNYVIEPSSAYYANALGSSDALAGIMIGAQPWFAMLSAVGYSFWTNSTYKTPILFSGSLMMIGNLMYSNAYEYSSMEMCLIGRAITGLGAPRVINRRYVADATPFYLRTASSAAFATATALGAALGPGTAIILDLFDFKFYIPGLGEQAFNGMTGPGYFMACCWAVYLFFVILYFKEPTRSGIDELRQREGAKASAKQAAEASQRKKALLESYNAEERFDDTENSQSDDSSLASLNVSSDKFASFGSGAHSPLYCIRHMTRAVAVCMSLVFMKRVALESIVASTSVITKNRYGWTIRNVGGLHLLNGIIVIPVTIMSGWLSQFRKDRHLALWFIAITLFGMTFLVDLTDLADHESSDTYNEGVRFAVGPHKYIIGSLIAFSGIEACESYVASLMSKVVPSALAVGTFNSGLLATLVGTGGRATGDLFITLMGLISIRNLLNLLIIPGMSLMILSIILIRMNYPILAI